MAKIGKNRRRIRKAHKVWQLQEAKARFSELVTEVEHDGYHTITKNGRPIAILLSKSEFEKTRMLKNSLLDFFRESPLSEIDLDIERSKDLGRNVDL